MRRSILCVAVAIGLSAPASVFAMGGGGGGMGGGYGGGGMMGGSGMGFDDYTMAIRLIHREKYADAIPYLDRALMQKPNSADVLNYLGFTHRMLGDYPGSLDYYQRALARDPDHKGAHEYLGELYLNMHQLGSARGQLAELTRLCPNDCDERDTLTKSIAAYEAASAAAPAATTSSQ
ncbi:MAG TPA: tetratricopeptide repeat protein [Rhizomicrobium sp.]|nr:tetratricopeptide repeat protein [Rhizomicrobium sp.]